MIRDELLQRNENELKKIKFERMTRFHRVDRNNNLFKVLSKKS